MDIQIEEEVKTTEKVLDIKVLYCYGNEHLKTWFITKTKKAFLPKGSHLLFNIGAIETDKEMSTSKSYPTIGDVVATMQGGIYEVKDVKWV